MKRQTVLRQTGVTTDGKPVYAGTFRFFETYGLPLSIGYVELDNLQWIQR